MLHPSAVWPFGHQTSCDHAVRRPAHPLCRLRKARSLWLVSGVLCLWVGSAGAKPQATLQLVQPLQRAPIGHIVAQHFARWLPHYLDEKVLLHSDSHGKGIEAINWAVRSGKPEQTVLLLSQEWLIQQESLPASVPSARNWAPVQMVLKGSWCLVASSQHNLPDISALQAWLRTLGRPVRLSVPYNFGPPQLWMRAMAYKTGLSWQAKAMDTEKQSIQALVSGEMDLALSRCGDMSPFMGGVEAAQRNKRSATQVLARVGAPVLGNVPSFRQWQLPPLTPGWIAWFVSDDMPTARRAAVGRALNAVLLRDDTQALIAAQQQQPVRMSMADSKDYVQRTQQQGQSLQLWLERLAEPELDVKTLER